MISTNESYKASIVSEILSAKEDIYNIDNYVTKISVPIDNKTNLIFSNYEILKKYENIIFDNSVLINLKDEYKYRPEHLCKAIYGTTSLWYIILFLNRITSASQFDKDIIRVIHPDNIGIFSEIYNLEKKYLDDVKIIEGSEPLKSIYAASDRLENMPLFKIGTPYESLDDSEIGSNSDEYSFNPISYGSNTQLTYFNDPKLYEFNNGKWNISTVNGISTYNSKIFFGDNYNYATILPTFLNGNATLFLSDDNGNMNEWMKSYNSLSSFIERPFKPMSYIFESREKSRVKVTEGINWYTPNINSLLVKFKVKNYPIQTKSDFKFNINLIYEGGNVPYSITKNMTFYGNDTVIIPVVINRNYGRLLTISLEILGKLSYVNGDFSGDTTDTILKNLDISYSYIPLSYEETTISLINKTNKNMIRDIKLVYDCNTILDTLISYQGKDFMSIGKSDLVNEISNINTNSYNTSGNMIRIPTQFKGLHLLDLSHMYSNSTSRNTLETGEDPTGSTDILYDNQNRALLYNGGNTINDYSISANLSCSNNISKTNGSMGFFFKGKTSSGKTVAYVYLIGMKNQYVSAATCSLSGLYRYDSTYENMNILVEGRIEDIHTRTLSPLTKIVDTPQYLSGNENETYIKIITKKNNIKIYDGTSNYPIINYFDPEEITFEDVDKSKFGLALFNINIPVYSGMSVLGSNE